jgi:hypothetical protein
VKKMKKMQFLLPCMEEEKKKKRKKRKKEKESLGPYRGISNLRTVIFITFKKHCLEERLFSVEIEK